MITAPKSLQDLCGYRMVLVSHTHSKITPMLA